ncbi:hypothetical protein LTR95_003007 [Oleoguttula sp. CCFEE 5521]
MNQESEDTQPTAKKTAEPTSMHKSTTNSVNDRGHRVSSEKQVATSTLRFNFEKGEWTGDSSNDELLQEIADAYRTTYNDMIKISPKTLRTAWKEMKQNDAPGISYTTAWARATHSGYAKPENVYSSYKRFGSGNLEYVRAAQNGEDPLAKIRGPLAEGLPEPPFSDDDGTTDK